MVSPPAPELTCAARAEPPLALLRAEGVLTLTTAPRLRRALFKCLADQPDAIVVEVAGLSVVDDIVLTLFRTVAHHATAWPCIPILLCAPSPDLAGQLRALGLDRHITVCATVEEARACAARRPLPTSIHRTFAPGPESVTLARRFAADACERWQLPHLVPAVSLVTSELVGNVVRHAGTPADVTVHRAARHLYVSVRDYSDRLPELAGTVPETEPGGRGLLLVSSVAAAWGCIPTRNGKVTWAGLSTTQR